jgi:ribose transport system permease protein
MSTTSIHPAANGATITARKDLGKRAATLFVRWSLAVLLITTVLLATMTTPGFFSFENLRSILLTTSVIGISAVGMTALTLSGNLVSLGISQQAVLGSLLFMAVLGGGAPLVVAVVVAVLALAAVGLLQGAVVAAGVNPMIVTLAAGTVIFGLATVATGGSYVTAPQDTFGWIATASLLGLPFPIYVFAVFTLIVTLVIDRTVAGRRILLVGSNRETARLSGISFRSATITAFVIFGIATAIAGIVSAAQNGQVTTEDLATHTSDVIAAVLVGGTAIQGGFGSPLRSAFGALMIAIFTNVMALHAFEQGTRLALVGGLVVLMTSLLHFLRKKAA